MQLYQITDLGSRYAKNPRLPHTPEHKVLSELSRRTGASKEQLEMLTGMDTGETTVALIKLQSARMVEKIR